MSILGWLPLHMETKLQNKTITKPRKISATSCHHFSLGKFCQVSISLKNKPAQNNVSLMNKSLNNTTLGRGYTVIISLETF